MRDLTKLSVFSWTPDNPKAIVVIAHGYADHARRFGHVAEYLVQQGYTVHASDQRGHGASKADSHGYLERFATQRDDLSRVIEWAHADPKALPSSLPGHTLSPLLSLYYTFAHQPSLTAPRPPS